MLMAVFSKIRWMLSSLRKKAVGLCWMHVVFSGIASRLLFLVRCFSWSNLKKHVVLRASITPARRIFWRLLNHYSWVNFVKRRIVWFAIRLPLWRTLIISSMIFRLMCSVTRPVVEVTFWTLRMRNYVRLRRMCWLRSVTVVVSLQLHWIYLLTSVFLSISSMALRLTGGRQRLLKPQCSW